MASPPGPAGPQQSSPKPDKDVLGAIKKIGKYEIQKKIGAGGMGAVYLALDPFLKRNCALKLLPQEKAKNPTLVRRFRSEAEQAAKLRHENIVAVFEANEADGFLYIALEYVEGTDVAALVQKRGLIPLKRSIEIVRQAAQALEHAHQQGIVHRDIKPGNLLVRRDGVVKVADLGLARNMDDVDTSITRAGTTVGTVDYMAPEQARDSKAADVRSDMYSLGCTWYFMLTGEPPFPEGSLTNKLRSHAESPLPDPRQKNSSVTEAVVGVLRRMTEKKPSKRYQTPAELLEDLDSSALTGDAVSNTILEDESDDTDYASGRSTDEDAAPRRAPPRSAEPADEAGDAAEGGGFWSRRKKKKKEAKRDETESDESVAVDEADTGRRKSKPPKRSADDGAPAFKPPPGRDGKDKSKLLEPDKKVKNNAALFYALVGLVVFGAVAGVIWAVGEYNSSSSLSGDRTANPFAQRDAVAKQAGPNSATGAPANVSGTATAVGPGPNAGNQLNTTTVGGGSPTAPGVGQPGTVAGPPGGDPGRLTSRIGGEVGGASDGPSGTNTEAGGDSATGSSPATSGQGATGAGNTGSGNVTGGSPTATAGSPSTGTKTTKIGGDATTTATSGSATAGASSGSPAGKSTGNRPANQPSAARIAQEQKAVPAWANEKRPVDGLPVLTVDLAGKGEGTFATLNKALEQAPAGGACIKLVGSGPFTLFATKIVDKKRIVIEPRDGNAADPPVVILLPAEEASTSNFLETVQTTLDLRQIHLALDATDFTTDPDDSILAAVSSDLYLQNCSISVKGRPESPMTAIKVSGKVTRPDAKSGVQPRVLIDQTLVRGNNLTALTVNGEHADLVCRGSLLWSGAAPAVRFGTIARSDADSSRVMRMVSSTLCALKAALVVGGDAGQPCPTAFEIVNSLVAAPTGGDASALLRLDGWNAGQQKTASGKFLNWKSTGSLYTGWTTLLELSPGPVSVATDSSQWQSAWKEKESAAGKDQFQPGKWPAREIADVAATGLEAFIPQTIGKQYVKTDDGGWPGCAPERLVMVNLGALAAAQIATVRPQIPPGMFAPAGRDVLRVDLTKNTDLGKFLEGKKLQTGTTIVVSGNGTRQSSPILIENAWIRMVFEPTEGPPLVIAPKSAESKLDGFITVRNGGLQIDRGAFAVSATERTTLPKWLIHVVDGDLGLLHCRLHGPLNGSGRNKGLIRWQSQTGAAPARPFDAPYSGYNVIQSSFLIGAGTLIDADMRHRAMIFHNSVLVSRDDLCALNLAGPDSEIDGAVDLRYSTLSAADRFFLVTGGELNVPASSPLSIYADRSVFGPPLRPGPQKVTPTLLSYAGSVFDHKQLSWWENRCGYSPDITTLVRPDAEEPRTRPQDFEESWAKLWGPGQVLEPLSGTNGVVLKKDLPVKADERLKLDAEDFQLHASCRAASWEAGKMPIGAYIGTMQLPPLRAAPAPPPEKKKTTKPATNAPSNAPGF